MRIPTYLSPSQLGIFESNVEEYYLQHLSDVRAPRIPQANYMSIGSSFDAYVKSEMHEILFGKGADPKFEFSTLFDAQVEEHNRDWALENGRYVLEAYKISGAYDELLQMLKDSACEPKFETTISGIIEGIPMLGKPDLRFIHKSGAHIILDFKVNGYCSKSAVSPCKNFRLCRDGWTTDVARATVGAGSPHKNYRPVMYKGMEIHAGYMEEASEDWSDQLSIYSWILDEPVGGENVVFCIDQICSKPRFSGATKGIEIPVQKPLLRVANHRSRISKMYQIVLMGRIHDCWNRITSGHIFKELSKEENDDRCAVLDQQAITMHACGDFEVSRKIGYK